MRKQQRGITLTGLILSAVVLILAAVLGMKTLPAYLEFFSAKKLIIQIANEQRNSTVADIRRAWDLKSSIDDVTTITSKDLEITKEGGQLVISFNYRKEVPLFANVGLYMDFRADSNATGD